MKRVPIFSVAAALVFAAGTVPAAAQQSHEKQPPSHETSSRGEHGRPAAQPQHPDHPDHPEHPDHPDHPVQAAPDSRAHTVPQRATVAAPPRPEPQMRHEPMSRSEPRPEEHVQPMPATRGRPEVTRPMPESRPMPVEPARPGRPMDNRPTPRLSQQQEQQRIYNERRRENEYRDHLAEQTRRMEYESSRLRQQRRMQQYRFQQEYIRELQLQQERLRAERDYANDPYYYTPYSYRYRRAGVYYETNQYGANLLRQAVNYGYQEGVRAGQADRLDGWAPDYRNSYAYQDANYGYTGVYVNQADYNYYFRQGFQRGYEDGYYNRYQYGTSANGSYSILGNLITSILGLQTLP